MIGLPLPPNLMILACSCVLPEGGPLRKREGPEVEGVEGNDEVGGVFVAEANARLRAR